MVRKAVFDASTGETIFIDVVEDVVQEDLETLRLIKLNEVMENYKASLATVFTTNALGQDMVFSYKEQDQLSYLKWATSLALNPTKDTVLLGSISHGVVSATRAQFIQIMNDIETNHEIPLYTKRKAIETSIKNAISVPDLLAISTAI